MVAQHLSENDRVTPTLSKLDGGMSKQARLHLRRPVRSRVFESYVRDLHEIIGLWLSGEISDMILRESFHETINAIDALDVNCELYTHLQRAHIVLLDRVLRDVHNLDDTADEGHEKNREQEELIEKDRLSVIDKEARVIHQNSAAKPETCPV